MIQAHDLWGEAARRAARSEREYEPWRQGSEYYRLTEAMKAWEAQMPNAHRWSLWNFRGYRSDRIHMVRLCNLFKNYTHPVQAYLSIVTITSLNNIVIRRMYIEE